MNEVAVVKLDDLNPKQRLKEFKTTQKELKSKELPVRQRGFEKIKDVRYLIEGNCLLPMLNTLSVKKSLLELTKLTLESLVGFLSTANKDDKTLIVTALSVVQTGEGHLNVLQIISDIAIHKEEVKKKKVPKKKQAEVVEEPVIENPLIVEMRALALRCIYYITCALYSTFTAEYKTLQSAVAAIPSIVTNFGVLVCRLSEQLSALPAEGGDVTVRVAVIQQCEYALMSLVFLMKYDKSAVSTLILTPLLTHIHILSKEKYFTHYCIQILEIISRDTAGVAVLTQTEHQELLLSLLEGAATPLVEAAAALTAPPVKGKEAKKDPPPKKGAPVVEIIDPYEHLERITIEPKRQCVVAVKLICNVYMVLSLHNPQCVEVTACDIVAATLSKLLLNPVLWQVTRDALSAPLDVPAYDAVDSMCVLLGTLASQNDSHRKSVVAAGGLTAILSVLQQSKSIIYGTPESNAAAAAALASVAGPAGTAPTQQSPEEQEAHNKTRLYNLRRVAGKAVLHLSTYKVPTTASVSVDSNEGGECQQDQTPAAADLKGRWRSCASYVTDQEVFTATPSLLTQLIDLIASTDDVDLSNRGVRNLSAVILGCGDGACDFVTATGLDTLVTAKLSVVIQARGQSIVDYFVEEAAKRAAALAVAEQDSSAYKMEAEGTESNPESAEPEQAQAEIVETPAATAPAPVPVPTVDLLVPTMYETFYLALSLLEQFLLCHNTATMPEVLKAFATRERVAVMSCVLTALGPVSSATATTTAAGSGDRNADSASQECSIPLRDPRVHGWYTTVDEDNTNATAKLTISVHEDSVFIRPLLLDTLALIAGADAKYRIYEGGDVPPAPCVPVPPSTSSVEEYSHTVCRLCADAVCSILLYQGSFRYTADNILTVVPAAGAKLELTVLDAALGLMAAIGSCGVVGVTAVLEAVAECGFNTTDTSTNCAMSPLKVLIDSNTAAAGEEGGSSVAAIPGGYVWKRPQFYTDVVPNTDDVLTSAQHIGTNQTIYPFIVLSGALQCVLADPSSTRQSTSLALKALMNMTRVSCWDTQSQPVILDILSSVFLSLGGAVTLTSLLGRFGNVNEEDKVELKTREYLTYILSRGAAREAFWTQYAEENKVVEVIDPKTGKPIVKKEEKKKEVKETKKVDPKAAAALPPIVSEIMYNIESSIDIPDPNRGPSADHCRRLLNVAVNGDLQLHSGSVSVSPLNSAIQGSLIEVALLLVNLGVDVNYAGFTMTTSTSTTATTAADGTAEPTEIMATANNTTLCGITPLMYALLYGSAEVTTALIQAGADVNALDSHSNPVLKYALMGVTPKDIDTFLPRHRTFSPQEIAATGLVPVVSQDVYGEATLLSLFLETAASVCAAAKTEKNSPLIDSSEIDILQCDRSGYSPVMLALGLGSIEVTVGGYALHIRNHHCVHNESMDYTSEDKVLYADVAVLQSFGASVDQCDNSGITPLHIAVARGDLKLIHQLISCNVVSNICDVQGFLPVHYVASCCPERTAVETFDVLMAYGIEKPIEPMSERTVTNNTDGAGNKQTKVASLLSSCIDDAFAEAFCPTIIQKSRVSYADLLLHRTRDEANILQLSMCGHVLYRADGRFNSFLRRKKEDRMTFALHLLGCMKLHNTATFSDDTKNNTSSILLNNVDKYNMNVLHSAAMLFQGRTYQRELTAAELRSKRVKSYPNKELQLLDIIHTHMTNYTDNQVDINAKCHNPHVLSEPCGPQIKKFTLMHCAIVYDNVDMAQWLLDHGFEFNVPSASAAGAAADNISTDNNNGANGSDNASNNNSPKSPPVDVVKWVHIMATFNPCREISYELAKLIVDTCAAQQQNGLYKIYLNACEGLAAPLHLAVRNHNMNVIRALVACHKVDLNTVDERESQQTAFHEACLTGSLDLVQAFRQGSDRLDLLKIGSISDGIGGGGDLDGATENCVEFVIHNGWTDILHELIAMRRNDVIECLIAQREKTTRSTFSYEVSREHNNTAGAAATVNNDDISGNDAVINAVVKGNDDVARAINDAFAGVTLDSPTTMTAAAGSSATDASSASASASPTAATDTTTGAFTSACVNHAQKAEKIEEEDHSDDTLLMQVERQNLSFAKLLGFTIPSPPVDVVEGQDSGGGGDGRVVVDTVTGEMSKLRLSHDGDEQNENDDEDGKEDAENAGEQEEDEGEGEGDDEGAGQGESADNDDPDGTAVAAMVVEEEEAEPLFVCTLSPDEYESTLNGFRQTNAVLRVVLDLVNDTGIVDGSHHVAEFYSRGVLIEEMEKEV